MKTHAFIAIACLSQLQATVVPHRLFSDHMVLQRNRPLPVWGTADPGEKVQVSFAGSEVQAVTDESGSWKVELPAMSASSTPKEMTIQGSNSVVLKDVLVGDVWLASGQSNMDSPLRSGLAAEALPTAKDPLIRMFTVKKAVSPDPLPNVDVEWKKTTPENARDFSAVAYFFACRLRESTGVPIGIIRSAWGGTPIVTWMDLASIEREPAPPRPIKEWREALSKHQSTKDQPELLAAYYKDMKEWETTIEPAFKAAKKAHAGAVASAKASGQTPPPVPVPERPEPVIPDPMAMPSASKRPSVPTVTHNAMIAPLAPFALAGVIWYQGEADGSRGSEYRVLFPRLIEGWRHLWNHHDLPFLFVQIPASGTDPALVSEKGMPLLREAQQNALSLPSTGMAVTLDIGDPADAHPDNKVHVGHRLALAARRIAYGENIVFSGPVYRSHVVEKDSVRIFFDHCGQGLTVAKAPWRASSMPSVPEDRLSGFCLAGADGKWFAAEARIDGNSVVVSCPQVPHPSAVAYGWGDSPLVNLYNLDGLPAAPFRSDFQPSTRF